MARRTKVVPPLDNEKDNANSISADLSGQEYRRKLLDKIALLRTYVSLLDSAIGTPKFGQLQWANNRSSKPLRKDALISRGVKDIQAELCYDLYRFMGMRCTNYEHRLVFEISSTGDVTKNNLYGVEISIDHDGRGRLGRWRLPMSIDVQELLSRYPIDDMNNVRYFLKSCKHHVDCYTCRMGQLEELQGLLSGVKNARVSYTIGITQIELTMLRVKDIGSGGASNVTLYLYYRSAQARPHRLHTDTDDNERPSTDLLKRLNKHFKPFLKMDLDSAFQQISESRNEFPWKKLAANVDENNMEICDEGDDGETGFLSEFIYRGDKRPMRSKNGTQYERDNLHDNETETSPRVEGDECVNTDITRNKTINNCPREDENIRSGKHKRLAETITKSRATKESRGESRKFRKGIIRIEKGNDENAARANNPVSSVARSIDRAPRQKGFKKRQTNIEGARVEDKTVLLGEDSNRNNNKEHLSKRADGKLKRIQKEKQLDKLKSNTDCEEPANSKKAIKRQKTITRNDKSENKEKHMSLAYDNNERANISCSTPLAKKLPDKRKFFHVSRISDISSVMKLKPHDYEQDSD